MQNIPAAIGRSGALGGVVVEEDYRKGKQLFAGGSEEEDTGDAAWFEECECGRGSSCGVEMELDKMMVWICRIVDSLVGWRGGFGQHLC